VTAPRARRPPPPRATAALAGAAPLAAAVAVAAGGEETLVGFALLWAEPALLAIAVYTTLWAVWEGWRAFPAATAAGVATAGFLVRVPPHATEVGGEEPAWTAPLAACARLAPSRPAPVRVLSWSLDPAAPPPPDALLLSDAPHLLVLHGLAAPEVSARLAQALGGEALFVPGAGPDSGLALITSGVFQTCDGDDASWALPLAGPGRDARAVVVFPELPDAGVVPLIAARLPHPGAPAGWAAWPHELGSAARQLAALGRALGTDRLVITGPAPAPRAWRPLPAALLGAGLRELASPATWPAAAPAHPLQRAFAGAAWTAGSAAAVSAPGQPRRGLRITLRPR